MATTIQIDGDQITLNDAASEETLKELVDLLKRQSNTAGGGASGSAAARQAKQTADNMTKGAKALKDASVKLGDVVETFDDIETKTGKTFTDIGAKIGDCASCTLYYVSCIIYHVSCILHLASPILYLSDPAPIHLGNHVY